MAAEEIEVNTPQLGRGGDLCRDAAASVRKAAEELGGVPEAGIFGGHAEAQQFHAALDAAHRSHQEELHGHHATLTGLSGKADTAARTFTDTDESGAAAVDSAAEAFDR
ncbi:DUF2563 family protein [Mycobacterium celatum]|uniref:DUF2563 domain-containing protein n=1 Tax=Mycobacterium celatum TaxID=28045 RepID=A0A1X1RQJ6_MYCCE|nr:DUF2563 family protein [Mycobacterium celatum]ORV12616.1 hypothetical protein AWB95_11875 [Mycobacterium celatum]PIB80890.1 DUF2563 domain-containing protein [Mycobacterium celatum]